MVNDDQRKIIFLVDLHIGDGVSNGHSNLSVKFAFLADEKFFSPLQSFLSLFSEYEILLAPLRTCILDRDRATTLLSQELTKMAPIFFSMAK